tara:strand:+ start:1043 stop:1405 length:363 start_codon:yes stop_codon:yes gene_type:complete
VYEQILSYKQCEYFIFHSLFIFSPFHTHFTKIYIDDDDRSSLQASSGQALPDSVWGKIQSAQGEGGKGLLDSKIAQSSALKAECLALLTRSKQLLDAEEQDDRNKRLQVSANFFYFHSVV